MFVKVSAVPLVIELRSVAATNGIQIVAELGLGLCTQLLLVPSAYVGREGQPKGKRRLNRRGIEKSGEGEETEEEKDRREG